MKKGITPVVAVVLLLIITVSVVGMGYTFVLGFFGTISGKAVFISGMSSCGGGKVNIIVTNVGTGDIAESDVVIVRTNCIEKGGSTCPSDPAKFSEKTVDDFPVSPEKSGVLVEDDAQAGINAPCGADNKCTYNVLVGAGVFTTTANC